MNKPLAQRSLCVKHSLIHGYGVFAQASFKRGELIEESYTLKLKDPHEKQLSNYYFKCKEAGFRLLPLGFGCIYNHSDQPNADYTFDAERSVMVFVAEQNIKPGEEIFIDYGTDWFEVRAVSKRCTSPYKHFYRLIFRFSLIAIFMLLVLYSLR